MGKFVFDRNDVEENRSIAVLLAIFPFLFFIPLLSEKMKNSAYMKFRANQSLDFFILIIIIKVIEWLIGVVLGIANIATLTILAPIWGILSGIVGFVINAVIVIIGIVGIVHAVNGTDDRYPILGGLELIG